MFYEITDEAATSSSIALHLDDLPHSMASGYFRRAPWTYLITAYAESTNGSLSRHSNCICISPKATFYTNNQEVWTDYENHECNCWLGDFPDWSDDLDPPVAPTIQYPHHWSTPWGFLRVLPVAVYPVGGVRRIRVYREMAGDPDSTRTLVASLVGDEQYYALEGWSVVLGDLGTEEQPNPLTECDPNVSYRVSFVDFLGRESPLSNAVSLPALGQQLWPLTTYSAGSGGIGLNWGPAPSCGALVGYHVYRADIPDTADCATYEPDPAEIQRLTADPLTDDYEDVEYVDAGPPGTSSNVLMYWVTSVGAPGDASAEVYTSNRVCVTPATAWLAPREEAPGEGGWAVASREPEASGARLVGQSAPPPEILFYHADHLGSPVVITGEMGELKSRHRYLPFGEEMTPLGEDTHRRRFTGHERDRETGLDYMMARYYAARVGRFLGVDPGDDTALEEPQSWNRYVYVRNNPLSFKDPNGEESYLCARPLDNASVSWAVDHSFVVDHAAGLGQGGNVSSYGNDGTGHVGEVTELTPGMSSTTSATDQAAWDSLSTASPAAGVACTQIQAPDSVVAAVANGVVSGTVPYTLVPEVLGGANSSSAAQAVANRASSAAGNGPVEMPGTRATPGSHAAAVNLIQFKPGTPGPVAPPRAPVPEPLRTIP